MAFDYRKEYARYQKYFILLRRVYEERPDIRAYLGILLSIVTISFLTVFALRPTLTTIAGLVSETSTQRQTLKKLDQKIADLEVAQSEWLQISPQLVQIDEAIPKKVQPAKFLQQVEGLAARHGVTLVNLSIEEVTLFGKDEAEAQKGEKKLPPKIAVLTFSVGVSGSYQQVLNFLSDFSNLRRPVLYNSFSLGGGKAAEGSIALAVSGSVPFLR